jgi:two-component system OmpR family response regulator
VPQYEHVEKVRLLVVDDDPPIADLVATVARYEGWDAVTAYTGEEGLRPAWTASECSTGFASPARWCPWCS